MSFVRPQIVGPCRIGSGVSLAWLPAAVIYVSLATSSWQYGGVAPKTEAMCRRNMPPVEVQHALLANST